MADTTDALNRVSDGLTLHAQLLAKLNTTLEGLPAKLQAAAGKAPAAAPGGAAGGPKGFMDGISSMTGALATGATAVVGAITGMVAAATRFVAAFNPALVELFNQSLRDLQAAIGSFLGPIVEAARGFVEQINTVMTALAPAILPIVEQLGAVMASVGTTLATALLPVIDALLPALQAGIDVYKVLAEALKPLLDVVAALAPILGTLGRLFGTFQAILLNVVMVPLKLLGAVLTPLLDVLAPILEVFGILAGVVGQVVKELADAFLGLLKSLGLDDFTAAMRTAVTAVRGFINAVLSFLGLPRLRERPAAGEARTQAAGEARFIDTLEIGRQARLAAAGAGAGRPPTGDQADLQINLLGSLVGGLETLGTRIITGFGTEVTRLVNSLGRGVSQTAENVRQNIPGWLQRAAGGPLQFFQ